MILVPLLNPKFAIVFAARCARTFGFGALVLAAEEVTGLKPSLNLFGDCLGILCRRYRAAIAIAGYPTSRRLAATSEFAAAASIDAICRVASSRRRRMRAMSCQRATSTVSLHPGGRSGI